MRPRLHKVRIPLKVARRDGYRLKISTFVKWFSLLACRRILIYDKVKYGLKMI